ncbi:MAG: periplasmic heavy metal sensor [Planctomycetes bacterium]|nr:periplasmic heavy metal sensor [Planctomycetota bacterium]
MKTQWMSVACVACVLALFVVPVSVQACSGCGQPSREDDGAGANASASTWEEAVRLTPEQKARLAQIDASLKQAMQELDQKTRETQKEVQALMADAGTNLEKIKPLIKRSMGYHADRQIAMLAARVEREQSLTPDQRKALAGWQARHGGSSTAKGAGCGSGCGGGSATPSSGGCGSTSGSSGGGCGGH